MNPMMLTPGYRSGDSAAGVIGMLLAGTLRDERRERLDFLLDCRLAERRLAFLERACDFRFLGLALFARFSFY